MIIVPVNFRGSDFNDTIITILMLIITIMMMTMIAMMMITITITTRMKMIAISISSIALNAHHCSKASSRNLYSLLHLHNLLI